MSKKTTSEIANSYFTKEAYFGQQYFEKAKDGVNNFMDRRKIDKGVKNDQNDFKKDQVALNNSITSFNKNFQSIGANVTAIYKNLNVLFANANKLRLNKEVADLKAEFLAAYNSNQDFLKKLMELKVIDTAAHTSLTQTLEAITANKRLRIKKEAQAQAQDQAPAVPPTAAPTAGGGDVSSNTTQGNQQNQQYLQNIQNYFKRIMQNFTNEVAKKDKVINGLKSNITNLNSKYQDRGGISLLMKGNDKLISSYNMLINNFQDLGLGDLPKMNANTPAPAQSEGTNPQTQTFDSGEDAKMRDKVRGAIQNLPPDKLNDVGKLLGLASKKKAIKKRSSISKVPSSWGV